MEPVPLSLYQLILDSEAVCVLSVATCRTDDETSAAPNMVRMSTVNSENCVGVTVEAQSEFMFGHLKWMHTRQAEHGTYIIWSRGERRDACNDIMKSPLLRTGPYGNGDGERSGEPRLAFEKIV